jgi:hypothetical protein
MKKLIPCKMALNLSGEHKRLSAYRMPDKGPKSCPRATFKATEAKVNIIYGK